MDKATWRAAAGKLALSQQQLRIVELILRGRQDKEIAQELGVSFHTVRTYLKRFFVTIHGLCPQTDTFFFAWCGAIGVYLS